MCYGCEFSNYKPVCVETSFHVHPCLEFNCHTPGCILQSHIISCACLSPRYPARMSITAHIYTLGVRLL